MTLMANAVGADFTLVETRPSFKIGTHMKGDSGKEYVYCQASGTIVGAGYVARMNTSWGCSALNTGNDAGGILCGTAPAAMIANDYGWVQIKGVASIRVAANCAANVKLNTTGTNGQVDDDGTAGAFRINGMFTEVVAGGAAANVSGFLNYPYLDYAAI